MIRHTLTWMTLCAVAALAAPGLASAADPAMSKDGMLVDSQSMTLYTFNKDAMGKSMCNDKCAEYWPPLMATMDDKASGDWTIIKRDDGNMQWAYKGSPLYTFKKDEKAGDMTGEGKMEGAWHVAKP